MKVRDLFGGLKTSEPGISSDELMSKVRNYLSVTGLSVTQFEDRVGCVVEPALKDSSKVMDWNVDFLRWVCAEIGLDWHLALP